jgi:hypothetical protein
VLVRRWSEELISFFFALSSMYTECATIGVSLHVMLDKRCICGVARWHFDRYELQSFLYKIKTHHHGHFV